MIDKDYPESQISDSILCPYCANTQNMETTNANISYWGEDSLKRINCDHCDSDFYVEERVERSFKTISVEEMSELERNGGLEDGN